VKRLERSGISGHDGSDWLESDPLAEFGSEPAPKGPVTQRPSPRPPATRPVVVPPARRAAAQTRGRFWPFALGVLLGALPSVIAVYWVTTWEPPRPEPVARVVSAVLPAVRPPIFAEHDDRDPPVIENMAPTVTPKVRSMISSPPVERTKPFVGSLQIDSRPQGARVLIDRKPAGVTPLVMTDLVAGSHVLRIEADGHTPWSSAIRVVANRQTDVSTILAPSLDSASVRP